jgi:DNA-cytosine methyltransferase
MTLKVLDLFSGLGAFSLGLERAGMQTVAFCEIDPYCRKILNKHWPDVPCYEDVRTLTVGRLAADGIADIDVICGGFPCQDVSRAGTGDGLDGERSGLWFEYARLIGEIRPRFAVVENVAALLDDGMGRVLGSLASLRYDAEWSVVSACAMGAPHMRRRVFLVAYPHGFHGRPRLRDTVARKDRPLQAIDRLEGARARSRARLEDPSALYRGADGIAHGMDRNRALGNTIYWPIVEEIGCAILAAGALAEGRAR